MCYLFNIMNYPKSELTKKSAMFDLMTCWSVLFLCMWSPLTVTHRSHQDPTTTVAIVFPLSN